MAHINDLNPEVLYCILCLASGKLAENIDKWKDKLTLLQVCTKWYDLFKNYVFSQGFVGIYSLKRNSNPYINMKSCVFYADSSIVCRSNLGIIIGRDEYNCDCVSELIVGVDRILNISMYGHILQKLSILGIGYWLNMTSLTLDSTLRFPPPRESTQRNLEELSATVSKYIFDFENRLPNITCLGVTIQEDETLIAALWIVINHYSQRLQHLHLHYPIKRQSLPSFSTELTSLSLNFGISEQKNPSFNAKSLQYLNLYNISSSKFSWWIFHGFTTPGCIEFTNLKTLDLSYGEQTEKERELSDRYSKQAKPYGSHMLQFPKLENLTLRNPPVDCDVFYTDTISAHLELLYISGNVNSIVTASRLRFTSVNKMYIVVGWEEALNNDFYIAADFYFGYIKIEGNCTAGSGSLIDLQRTVSWVNVTDLHLYKTEFDELLEHIPNLYNLRYLRVDNVCLSNGSLSIIRLGLEEEEQGKFELLDTKLEHTFFVSTEPNDPYNLLATLNHFLLRTATLKKISVSYRQLEIVKKSFLPEKFSHVEFS